MTATLPARAIAGLPVTSAALDQLRSELAELLARRPAVMEAIRNGSAGGDAADQAEFRVEIAALAELDDRIAELDARIATAVVVERVSGTGRVEVGSVVTVRFAGATDTERYVVGVADLIEDDLVTLSPESPMGAALLGAAVGDEVSYAAPRGRLTLTVVDC